MSVNTSGTSRTERRLPTWLGTYTTLALYGLVLGTLLSLASLFTNPVPDPSFPWFTLPEAVRLPLSQPRIEHWPVTYTVGIWLWVFGAPALFLNGYQRYGGSHRSTTAWLVGLPTAAMLALTTYCRFFWPKLDPATWNAPSYTLICWLYCSSYDPLWSNLAYGVATVGVVAVALASRRGQRARYAIGAFGLLALPLGLPALYEAYRRGNPERR
jgi:hypothetical protein